MQSNGNVQEAARDSALIYARMIDSLARNYKLPVENIVSSIQVTEEGPLHTNEFHSPVNSDVKADTLVTVVDLTDQLPKGPLSRQELTQKVKELFANQPKMETADGKATISSPGNTRKMRHFINSSLYKVLHFRRNKEWESRHQASVLNIDKLIRNSVLIESEPNRKGDKKKDVAKYHHFYIPIKVGDKLYTARIVGEEMKGSTSINPIDVKLYDVIIAKKGTFSKATQGDLQIENVPFTITISEMLQNVKDSHNQPFINKDGTLSQGINFYANNDSNYHQTVEELTGKKDLIAYHNISQDNLDNAIQLEVFESDILFNRTPATLYEISDRKIKTARPDKTYLKSSGLGEKSPINYTLLEILGECQGPVRDSLCCGWAFKLLFPE